ncbi:MAG: hypothetical protein LBT42_02590 [Tannerella sp.]|nr:hypothetical protein [Tannerella sp.]
MANDTEIKLCRGADSFVMPNEGSLPSLRGTKQSGALYTSTSGLLRSPQ